MTRTSEDYPVDPSNPIRPSLFLTTTHQNFPVVNPWTISKRFISLSRFVDGMVYGYTNKEKKVEE